MENQPKKNGDEILVLSYLQLKHNMLNSSEDKNDDIYSTKLQILQKMTGSR